MQAEFLTRSHLLDSSASSYFHYLRHIPSHPIRGLFPPKGRSWSLHDILRDKMFCKVPVREALQVQMYNFLFGQFWPSPMIRVHSADMPSSVMSAQTYRMFKCCRHSVCLFVWTSVESHLREASSLSARCTSFHLIVCLHSAASTLISSLRLHVRFCFDATAMTTLRRVDFSALVMPRNEASNLGPLLLLLYLLLVSFPPWITGGRAAQSYGKH